MGPQSSGFGIWLWEAGRGKKGFERLELKSIALALQSLALQSLPTPAPLGTFLGTSGRPGQPSDTL